MSSSTASLGTVTLLQLWCILDRERIKVFRPKIVQGELYTLLKAQKIQILFGKSYKR